MVDAAVELVVHPGGLDLAQQGQRLLDQVVVVEQPAPVLLGPVAGDHRVGDGDQRGRAIAAGDGLAALEQRGHALALAHQTLGERGVGGLEGLGDDAVARLAGAGEEDPAIDLGARFAVRL